MREPLALPELPSDLPDPLAAAIRATDLEAIWAAISNLPRHQRRALLLRELGGLSYHELGRALGVSHSAVESLLFRARRHVRKLVAAATPLAFRDELSRLIPGLDPATASVAARVAAMPVALKLATAAVSVGFATTGAGPSPEHSERHRALTPPAHPAHREVRRSTPPHVVVVRQTVHTERRHEERHRGHGGEREPAEHNEVEHKVVEVEQPQVGEHHDGGGGSDSSGPGPGPSQSGSGDHSGSSGGDSHSGTDG